MKATSVAFKANAARALHNEQLQRALAKVPAGFIDKRRAAADALPGFETLRDQARDIKDHTLAHLDLYLEAWEKNVVASGGHVHWCETPADGRRAILDICARLEARTVTKGKSMITEELAINDALADAGITPVETDLGEYIIQLRNETPSHVIGPAIHVNKDQIEQDFRSAHTDLPKDRDLSSVSSLVNEARQILRQKYISADVGITGANFLVAETGTSIIVTNEGNGDLTQILPKVHIVIASMEKMVPTLEDASTLLRLLARSATGQEFSSYTTYSTGPRRADDPDGPGEYHVIMLDNGRTDMLGTEFQDMLRCIKCGACMNHCPVYQAIGGHAYGWVYPGPMGSVLTPALIGIDAAGDLPNASTLCGRCEAVCPMRIPLPRMLRQWRERQFERRPPPPLQRISLAVWAFVARRPAFYRAVSGVGARVLSMLAGRRGRYVWLPLAGGWTRHRDFPAPEGRTFMARWKAGERAGP